MSVCSFKLLTANPQLTAGCHFTPVRDTKEMWARRNPHPPWPGVWIFAATVEMTMEARDILFDSDGPLSRIQVSTPQRHQHIYVSCSTVHRAKQRKLSSDPIQRNKRRRWSHCAHELYSAVRRIKLCHWQDMDEAEDHREKETNRLGKTSTTFPAWGI